MSANFLVISTASGEPSADISFPPSITKSLAPALRKLLMYPGWIVAQFRVPLTATPYDPGPFQSLSFAASSQSSSRVVGTLRPFSSKYFLL